MPYGKLLSFVGKKLVCSHLKIGDDVDYSDYEEYKDQFVTTEIEDDETVNTCEGDIHQFIVRVCAD